MKKTFCDICGAEITVDNHPGSAGPGRVSGKMFRNGISLGFEIMTSKDGVSNAGDFCRYCIIQAVAELGFSCRFCTSHQRCDTTGDAET